MSEYVLSGPYGFSLLFGILVIVLGLVKFVEVIRQYAPAANSLLLNKINYWLVSFFGVGMSVSGVLLILQPWESLFLMPEASFLVMSKTVFHISFYPLLVVAFIYIIRSFRKKNTPPANVPW